MQRRRSVADRGLSLLRPDLNVTLDILEDVPIRLAKELRPLVEGERLVRAVFELRDAARARGV